MPQHPHQLLHPWQRLEASRYCPPPSKHPRPAVLRPVVALVLAGALAVVTAMGALAATMLDYAHEARLDRTSSALNAQLVTASRTDCQFRDEWAHIHATSHRGRVWIRVEPAPQQVDRPHRFVAVWGPWAKDGWLDFTGQDNAVPEIYLLHTKLNRGAWPLSFRIEPPACVLFGVRLAPGQQLVSLDGPWRYHQAGELLQQAGLR